MIPSAKNASSVGKKLLFSDLIAARLSGHSSHNLVSSGLNVLNENLFLNTDLMVVFK